jgi:hypothetical protein
LRATKRLVLVLDLDHTLLNSVRLNDVSPEHEKLLQGILEAEADKPHKLLHCLRYGHSKGFLGLPGPASIGNNVLDTLHATA